MVAKLEGVLAAKISQTRDFYAFNAKNQSSRLNSPSITSSLAARLVLLFGV